MAEAMAVVSVFLGLVFFVACVAVGLFAAAVVILWRRRARG